MSTFRLSQRVSRIGFSPNSAASQRAKQLKASGVDILDLTIGEPDFETPDHIKAAAVAALAAGQTRYTPALGTAALRAAVRAKLARENRLDYELANIAVANGAKQVIYNALAATLDAGDEVVIPAPYYPSFPEMVRVNDGTTVIVPTLAEHGFRLEEKALASAINARTRWLIINSPSNPSGAVYGEAEWRMIARLMHQHPQLLLLLDEVYEHILFIDPPAHFLHIAPELRERVLVVNGLSKTYAMTGWRVGYGAGPRPLIEAMGVMQIQSTSGACAISQAASVAALEGPQDEVIARAAVYRQRRDLLLDGLAKIPDIHAFSPAGGFFVFVDCRALIGRHRPGGAPINDDRSLADYLLEAAGVALVAGSAYGSPGYLRLSIAADTRQVGAAAARIAGALAQLSKEPVHA
jgi:aspartate aminotransferase